MNRLREKKLKSYTEADGFQATSIVPITQDRAGDTCGLEGPAEIRFHEGRFTTYPLRSGLTNDCVWALCADRDGSLWIGTWGAGLKHFTGGRLTTYNPDNSGLSGRVVKAIWQDREGAIWVGTDYGLNRFQNGKFTVWR